MLAYSRATFFDGQAPRAFAGLCAHSAMNRCWALDFAGIYWLRRPMPLPREICFWVVAFDPLRV